MSNDLLELVEQELFPSIITLGFRVVEAQKHDSFDNASVVLQADALRLRIFRERSQIFADLGPSSEPGTWFDSAVIVDYLGLSEDGGFHDRDATRTMRGIASFIESFFTDLEGKFTPSNLARTKRELAALRDTRADRMFGTGGKQE